MRIPPFETFYAEHKDPVFSHLRRLLGPGAEDAFQETFLRALRAYPELRNGRHLRAWVFTIATRVAIDEARRARPRGELPELAVEDGLPPHAELGPLTDDLPPKERAAVVLRYGFDLPYDEIAAALGSSEDAARQAASSGVRRLRRSLATPTKRGRADMAARPLNPGGTSGAPSTAEPDLRERSKKS